MDSALLYAYILDLGWFLLLTGALTLLATILIFLGRDFSEEPNSEFKREGRG
jgi:hypothetical protein